VVVHTVTETPNDGGHVRQQGPCTKYTLGGIHWELPALKNMHIDASTPNLGKQLLPAW
jgi:hypothetical protein